MEPKCGNTYQDSQSGRHDSWDSNKGGLDQDSHHDGWDWDTIQDGQDSHQNGQ